MCECGGGWKHSGGGTLLYFSEFTILVSVQSMEEEFLHERLPSLMERVKVSSRDTFFCTA